MVYPSAVRINQARTQSVDEVLVTEKTSSASAVHSTTAFNSQGCLVDIAFPPLPCGTPVIMVDGHPRVPLECAHESVSDASAAACQRQSRHVHSMSDKIWHLARCDLFERLPPADLRRLEARARIRSYPRRCAIYLPADASDAVLLLASGRVKICHTMPDGKQSILSFVEPGELFGELALVDAGQREEYAESVEPSAVVMIPRDEVEELMQSRPEISLGVTKLVGLRLRRIERRLKYLLFRSARERLVHLLLELVERYGKRSGSEIRISLRLSHQDMASIIGSTRETVTLVLGELQAEGSVRLARREVVLTQAERLAASVGDSLPVELAGTAGSGRQIARPAAPPRSWPT